jgi:cytidylate kinase
MRKNFEKQILIAIDGPSASGKSSIAKKIAEHFGFSFLNTGKIYRFIALKFIIEYGLKNLDENQLESLCIQLIKNTSEEEIMRGLIFEDEKINSEECGFFASKISKFISLRKSLEDFQRKIAFQDENGSVLEGRDIGSIIIPEADFKIFVTASIEERAKRRFEQLKSMNDDKKNYSFEEIKKMIEKRDHEDSSREYAPLIITKDAFLLDTSNLDFEESVNEIINYIELKKKLTSSSIKNSISSINSDILLDGQNIDFSHKKI